MTYALPENREAEFADFAMEANLLGKVNFFMLGSQVGSCFSE